MLGAKPTTYIKIGVLGDLQPVMVKCLGRIQKLYYAEGKDLFITSMRESTHGPGSLHHIGLAIDFKKQKMSIQKIRAICGPGFDVIDEGSHVHVEFDPR